MRILTCNLQSGGNLERTPALWAYLRPLRAGAIVLTEYRAASPVGSFLRDQLVADGYAHIAFSTGERGVLVAAREPFAAVQNPAALERD